MQNGPGRTIRTAQVPDLRILMTREEKLNYIASHYMNVMWQKAYSVLSDAHEAEDACQEAFIKLMRIEDKIEDVTEPRVRALCGIIARNTAVDMARKNGRTDPTEDIYMDLEAKEQPKASPEQELTDKEAVSELISEIKALPDTYRDVLMLRCLNELSPEETARALSCSVNSVNIRLTRARKLLKERMEGRSGL